jgi:hypothetical protein
MKRVIILLVMTLALSAQGTAFGIKAGLNNGSNSSADESTNGFTAGLLFNIDAALVNVDIEALYTDVAPDNGKSTYLHVPVTARFNLLPMLFVRGGVQYDHLLSMEAGNQDLIDNTNNGLSIVLGAGASFDLPVLPGLIVDARYTIPMYNTADKSAENGIPEDITVNMFQLTVGVMF